MISPPSLTAGDQVVILSPSGRTDKDLVYGQKERLESWGLRVKIASHALDRYHNYAATPGKRLSDLQKAMDHPEIKALFCSRGGYGAIHLLEDIDFARFRETPKWLVGFSDITALHNLFQKEGFASIHGPMGRHLAKEPAEDPSTLHLRSVLFGEKLEYSASGHPCNHTGTATGVLRGGNLAVLYGLRGTPYDIPAEGTILVIEDVGERPYHIERMLYSLKLGGVLEKLSGIIVGQFTEYTEDKGIGKTLYEMIRDMLKPYNCPVCFDFPVGHTTHNEPLILGSTVTLEVTKKETRLFYPEKDS